MAKSNCYFHTYFCSIVFVFYETKRFHFVKKFDTNYAKTNYI